MFQRKFVISENPWIDLDGNKQDKKINISINLAKGTHINVVQFT